MWGTLCGRKVVALLVDGDKTTPATDIKTALRFACNLWERMMSKTTTTRHDVAEHLRTPEEMAAYLEACLEEADGDAAFIAKALGDIARAKGMAQVAQDAGLSRESLYKALSGEQSPDFDTILKVVGAPGLKLHAKAPRVGLRPSTSRPRSRTTKRRAA
jgi:probable addiction module antidote protein